MSDTFNISRECGHFQMHCSEMLKYVHLKNLHNKTHHRLFGESHKSKMCWFEILWNSTENAEYVEDSSSYRIDLTVFEIRHTKFIKTHSVVHFPKICDLEVKFALEARMQNIYRISFHLPEETLLNCTNNWKNSKVFFHPSIFTFVF